MTPTTARRRSSILMMLTAFMLAAFLAAGCGDDTGDETADAEQTAADGSQADTDTADGEPGSDDIEGDQGSTTGSDTGDDQSGGEPGDADGTGDEPDSDDDGDDGEGGGSDSGTVPRFEGENSEEGWRLAPAGNDRIVLLWDEDGATVPGHTGDRSQIVVGPFFEIAYTTQGVVYQRPGRDPWAGDSTVWLQTGSGQSQALIGAGNDEHMMLEGAVQLEDGVEVYYQLRSGETPETARSVLYRLTIDATGTVGSTKEIMTTGGWESSSTFSTVESYPVAVALRGAEAETWFELVDLDDGTGLYESQPCFDGEAGCTTYRAATALGGSEGSIYGMRPVWNEDAGWIDSYGLFRFDPDGEIETLMARFEWDNGLWYPESILALDNTTLAVSVRDDEGRPLPALVVEIGDGDSVTATTLPDAGFVRWFDLT